MRVFVRQDILAHRQQIQVQNPRPPPFRTLPTGPVLYLVQRGKGGLRGQVGVQFHNGVHEVGTKARWETRRYVKVTALDWTKLRNLSNRRVDSFFSSL